MKYQVGDVFCRGNDVGTVIQVYDDWVLVCWSTGVVAWVEDTFPCGFAYGSNKFARRGAEREVSLVS